MCVTLCIDQISNYGFKNINAYVLSGSLYDLETINEIIKLMWKFRIFVRSLTLFRCMLCIISC